MPNYILILLAVLLVTIFPEIGFSQIQVSPDIAKQSGDFVSTEGEFTVALPAKTTRFAKVEPVERETEGGSKMGWNTPQGAFVFSFTNYLKTPENPLKIYEELSNDIVGEIKRPGGKLIRKKETAFLGNPGLEVWVDLGKGQTMVYRYFFVKKRLYILTTGWKDGENGETQLKILNSFKLLDRNALIAKQIEDVTPKMLPQSPVVAKLKSDAEDDNLKGRIKKVTVEEEYLSKESEIQGRYFNTITDYNENGNRIKQLTYALEMPFEISVFGYIDGMRVIDSKMLADVPDLSFLKKPGTKPPKEPDPRYDFSIEYKYADGKLSEEKWLKNDGADWIKVYLTYKGNQTEEIAYDESGKTNRHTISTFDEKGNKIEETDLADNNRKYVIKYDSFDEKGNWTKSTKSEATVKKGKTIYEPLYAYYRTITYYP